MEKISTPAVASLPNAANLATLVVVLLATWWSGTQRPVDQPQIATSTVTAAAPATAALPLQQAGQLAGAAGTAVSTPWPAGATSIARDSLQAVNFQPRTTTR